MALKKGADRDRWRSRRRAAGVGVPAAARSLGARLAQHPLPLQPLDVLLHVLPPHLGPRRRFRAEAPRHQPEASSARPLRQGPLPAPAAQCPAPTAAWVTTGSDTGTPIRASPRACPRPEWARPPAAPGPSCHHEPSRHCRPGDAYVPIRAAGVRPVQLNKGRGSEERKKAPRDRRQPRGGPAVARRAPWIFLRHHANRSQHAERAQTANWLIALAHALRLGPGSSLHHCERAR